MDSEARIIRGVRRVLRRDDRKNFWSALTSNIPWILTAGSLVFTSLTYYKTQHWKHLEILSAAFKDFNSNYSVKFYNKVLDYDRIKIPLRSGSEDTLVTKGIVSDALRTENLNFDSTEIRIRDLTDDYLDQLGQLYLFVDDGSITYKDVETRLSYYLDILTSESKNKTREEFNSSLKNYMQTYGFKGALALVSHYSKQKH